MTALLLLTHQPPEAVNRMTRQWRNVTHPDHVIVAYGGSLENLGGIEEPHVFIGDARLRTRDHPREKQSYTEVLNQAVEALREKDWDYLYLAEFDIEPLSPDLFTSLRARAVREDADLLGHRALRIDDTLHAHYADHACLTEWREWIRSLSRREDREVVLSCMGCGQWWRREALEAVLECGEPHEAYLEVQLPTVAHHLGFRVRGMGEQDRFIRTEPLDPQERQRMADGGAWVVHPVKRLWVGADAYAGVLNRPAPKVLHITHFDPPLHGEAMMACQLRECASGWDDIEYRFINTAYATSREALSGASLRKFAKLPWYLLRMVAELIRFRPDLVLIQPAFHPGPFLKDSLFVWIARAFGVQVVAWVHMDPNRLKLEEKPAWFQKWVNLTLRQIETFVACAPSLPATWPDWISSRPCVAVANAIPDPLGGNCPASPERSQDAPLRVIYISAMHHEKGWQDLFQAACIVCDQRADIEFHFHGNVAASDEPTLRETFASSCHPDRIQWLGAVWGKEKFHCLRRADLFVMPSHTEQFSLAVLEAMACGLPIVATRVGATADALAIPEGGCLIQPGAVGEMVDAVTELAASPSQLRDSGDFNRARFLRHFDRAAFGGHWQQKLRQWTAASARDTLSSAVIPDRKSASADSAISAPNGCGNDTQ